MPGRKRCFCSSLPNAIRVGASSPSPMWPSRPGPPARAYSSCQITCWISDAPRPPASRGQPSPIQPASPSRRSHARRSSIIACSSPGPPRPRSAANGPVRWAASHACTSRRNASSSSEKRSCTRTPVATVAAGRGGPPARAAARRAGGAGIMIRCVSYARRPAVSAPTADAELPFAARTIPALALEAAERFGDAPFLEEGPLRLGFASFAQQALRAARAFLAAGVEPGDRVALWAPNLWEWPVVAVGLQAAGGVLVPLSTRFKGREAGFVLRRSRARLLVTMGGTFLGMDYVAALRDEELPALARIVALRAPADGAQPWEAF